MKSLFSIFLLFIITGCTSIPEGIQPVSGFEKEKYLGTWYEIARLDHSFERDMVSVTANYDSKKDGGIRVLNRGYNTVEQEWDDAEGKAYFVGDDSIGHLKVSFFGPFYGAYVIFHLDKESYQYSYVCGPNRNFLWFLSRTPEVAGEQKSHFIEMTQKLGFPSEDIIWVDQSKQL